LSGEPSTERYRVSVKREAHGAAGAYIHEKLQIGDIVDASAAGGAFTLRPSNVPVALLSAGIGATPVLAMLYALAAEASPRDVWWIHGARNRREHPFAEETRTLRKILPPVTLTFATARQIPRTG
jgi:ferredoxin-NADP reductase